MNGHHADCSCQSCTIGREIGMDRALELIREMQNRLSPLAEFAKHYPTNSKYGTRPTAGTLLAVESGEIGEAHITVEDLHEAVASIGKASAFLSEHAEHE